MCVDHRWTPFEARSAVAWAKTDASSEYRRGPPVRACDVRDVSFPRKRESIPRSSLFGDPVSWWRGAPHPPASRLAAFRRNANGPMSREQRPRASVTIGGALTARPEISVVIPVYNEEENLPALLPRLLPVLDGLGRPYEV